MIHQTSRAKQTTGDLFDPLKKLSWETLGLDPRDVQVNAAKHLTNGLLVEMKTGEGKTLAIALAASVLAEQGRKVLVATANEYLARRDAEWMGPLFQSRNQSVTSASTERDQRERRCAYDHEVVYGTLRQFAFDFLRQHAANRSSPTARNFEFEVLIVDEADSLLIDEARTPLVIRVADQPISEAAESCYRWATRAAEAFQLDKDYVHSEPDGAIALTKQGRSKLNAAEMPSSMNALTTTDIGHALERAILVNETMVRDRQYIVRDQRVEIIDEFTGRASADRTFGSGIQQAIEAREGLGLSPQSRPLARITVQEFVSQFDHLCGITATACPVRQELRDVYNLPTAQVPTFKTSRLQVLPTMICDSASQKWHAIANECRAMIDSGRAVLIGSPLISESKELSRVLDSNNISHVVLNAIQHQQEAEVVRQAGQPGSVTVATNMAGRGTDIPLHKDVFNAGGLHVIVAQMNSAARIDAQLIGRCARQGQPGTARTFLCPDDQVFWDALGKPLFLPSTRRSRVLRDATKAQRKVERKNRRLRRQVAIREAELFASLRQLGLDPYLDMPGDEND